MALPIVSIIIPCYNASNYIKETLISVLAQNDVEIEIILVDDGSTDDTKKTIESITDDRIKYFYQKNQGVSAARNNGFTLVKGVYTVFCDADDIMPIGFLSSRLEAFNSSFNLDFVCGVVQKFNEHGMIDGYFRGTGSDAAKEILLYDSEIVTCPSNYMFRSDFLRSNHLLFNTKLSSTADKYFLLQCAKAGNSLFIPYSVPLHYRVAQNSMSHKLTNRLVLDNEMYYQQLIKTGLIPEAIQNKSLFLRDFILFASYWKTGRKVRSLKFAIKGFFKNPFGFIKKCWI